MKIDCIIFDCDGLMFDTERLSQENWIDVAKRNGVTLPDDLFICITGAGHDQFNETMARYPFLYDILDEIRLRRYSVIYDAIEVPGALNKKGLTELLQYLEDNNIKKAVASSSKTDYVHKMLDSIGKPFHFDAILGGDQVPTSKPNPAIFLKAAQQCGCLPENCLVLEDSKMGTLAAKRAGMHRVFIKDLIEPDDEMKSYLEFSGDSLLDVIPLLEN